MLVSTTAVAAVTGGCLYYIFKNVPEIPRSLAVKECRDIPDLEEKYRCYSSNALSTSDISWCKKIPFNYCGVGFEYNQGRHPLGNHWQSCIESVAVSIKDRDLCNLIPIQAHGCDPNYPSVEWRDSCNYKLAIFFHDSRLCGKMFNLTNKQSCHDELIARTKYPQNFPKPY